MAAKETLKTLVQRSFNSVKSSDDDSVNAMAVRLSKTLLENLNFNVEKKTLTNYYNRYVLQKAPFANPDVVILNALSKNLGYSTFEDFKSSLSKSGEKRKQNTVLITLLIILPFTIVLLLGVDYFKSDDYGCVSWNGEAYVESSCKLNTDSLTGNLVIRLNSKNENLKEFRAIEPTIETQFFKNGKAIVWYLKVDGEVEFFNSLGRHPITGKTLKEVTPHIVEQYVK